MAAVEEKLTIGIRPLVEIADLHEAVRVQKIVWRFNDIDLLPPRLFVVATKIGGQVFGAFDGNRMVGFCLAIPGLKAGGQYYLHSHMLGVLPEYENRGVGRALKLAQREDAMTRGIELVEWTFDPLEIKNSHFNIERLGAIVRRFVANQYGISSSPLHGGLPTDRCVAEWWIASPRVRAIVDCRERPQYDIEARIEVPQQIGALKQDNLEQARAIQTRIREQFLEHLGRGLAVVGYEIRPQAGTFLLGRCE